MQIIKVLALLMMLLANASAWSAGKRVALVIGNAQYQSLNRLLNPGSDAKAIAAKLQLLGFDLIGANGTLSNTPVLDLAENNFLNTIKNFSQQAQDAEIALFYYAGHGMQFDKEAYLLPVDVPNNDIDLIQRHAIRLNSVLKALDGKAELTIAIFDACREIPELEGVITKVTRSSGLGANRYRGLGRIQSEKSSGNSSRIIAFSGAAGQLVKDGVGGHSPYTAELLLQIDKGGQDVGDVFEQVAYNFGLKHGGQKPEMLNQGVPPNHYYFKGELADSLIRDDKRQLEISFWNGIKDSNNAPFFSAYITQFGDNGIFSALAKMKLQEFEEASKIKEIDSPFANAQDKNAQKIAVYLDKGRMYLYEDGRPERALDYFNKALTLDKQNAKIYYELGVANIKLFEYAEAIGHLEKAIKYNPNYSAAYKKLVYSFSALGDSVKAEYYRQYY